MMKLSRLNYRFLLAKYPNFIPLKLGQKVRFYIQLFNNVDLKYQKNIRKFIAQFIAVSHDQEIQIKNI